MVRRGRRRLVDSSARPADWSATRPTHRPGEGWIHEHHTEEPRRTQRHRAAGCAQLGGTSRHVPRHGQHVSPPGPVICRTCVGTRTADHWHVHS